MHGSYEGFPASITKPVREKVFGRLNGLVYLTPRNIEFLSLLRSVNPSLRMKQIYNGYIPGIFAQNSKPVQRAELGISDEDFVFIQVARGTEDKGWLQSINAFLRVKKSASVPVKLLLVGSGEYLETLRTKHASDPSLIFYGFSGNPIPLIRIADAGLLPTYYKGESLPNTVIEYLFSGKPVLASDIGEIPNMIGAGTGTPAGFVFRRSDKGPVNETELEEKMLLFLEQKEIYREHARNTAIHTEKFKMENCAKAYQDFFELLINNNE